MFDAGGAVESEGEAGPGSGVLGGARAVRARGDGGGRAAGGEGGRGGGGSGAGSPVRVAREALARVAGVDVSGCSDDELLAGAVALERVQRALDAAKAHVVGELDARGVCDERHGLRTGSWLAREAGLPLPAARRQVRVGAKLRRLASLDAALTDGRIGFEHARVLADAATPRLIDTFDAVVPGLVEEVSGARFEVWARDVAWVAAQLDVDGGHDPHHDVPADRLHVRWVGDELALSGRFHAGAAQTLKQVLDAATDHAWRRATRDHRETPDLPVPARSELAATALVELARRAAAATSGSTSAPVTDVSLVVHPERPDVATAPDGSTPTLDAVRSLVCDAAVTAVVLDHDGGAALAVGRTHRFATPAQRRALTARDGGCVFPGCDVPPGWCDAHHVVAWEDGGGTDVDTLAFVCRHHHGVSHREDWTMTATEDQRFIWITPSGDILHSQRHGRTRAGPAPPRAA